MKDQLILIYSYLHGIWQYRWSALVIAWLVALPGWVAVYALPDLYKSKAIIHIDTKSIIKPLLKGLAVESDMDSGLAFMKQNLLSRKNLEEVIRHTDMDLDANNPEAMDRIAGDLARSIKLTVGRQGNRNKYNIYELSYQGRSPDLVYKVVSKLLNTLIENTLNSARTDTESAQEFIEYQISEYEKRLTAAEQKLADFKRANLGLMPDKKGSYYNKLQQEQNTMANIRSELQLAQRKLSEIKKQLQGELPLVDNNRPQKVLKLRRYREQLENLLTQYTEQHPDVQALRATIAEVLANANESVDEDEFLDIGAGDTIEFNPVYQEMKAEMHRTDIEVETLKLKLIEKEKIVEALKKSVDIIPDVEAKFAKLNRDYEITRKRHLSLIERRESARLAQEVGQSGNNISFQIIDPPRVATKPAGPNRLLLLSMVLFAAVAAGLGWGFLRYFVQPTFIAPGQIRDRIGLPVLGSVSLFMTAEHKRRRQIQLASFLMVFSLLLASYGGVVVFRGSGSDLVHALTSLLSSMI